VKCPACWAEKAYVREVNGLRGALLASMLIVPMRCQHCYHEFHVSWFATIGKQLTPRRRDSRDEARPPSTIKLKTARPAQGAPIRRRDAA
jgi:hypothetical protein